MMAFNRNAVDCPTSGADDGKLTRKNVKEMTNQKMRFDVDANGHWLSVGDQVGPSYESSCSFLTISHPTVR